MTTFARDLQPTAAIDINGLKTHAVDVQPRDYDWDSDRWAEMQTDGGWDCRTAAECEECGAVNVGTFSVDCWNDDCPRYEEPIEEDGGPMMSYWYELPKKLGECEIMELVNLPLVYVEVDDTPGLALSGGGMDLSWEICEAYIRLGYLPPLHFAKLPAMCGRGINATDEAIARACERSADVMRDRIVNQAEYTKEGIQSALAFGRKHEEERDAA